MPQKIADIGHRITKPEDTNAYLVGGGIGSLAAAVHLLQDAHVPGNQIHVIESAPVMGGSMDGSGDATHGYLARGGRMLNFSYRCTYHLFSKVPSLVDPKKTIKEDIDDFNAVPGNRTIAKARVVATTEKGPMALDVRTMGLTMKQRLDIIRVAEYSESRLGTKRLTDCFDEGFFKTKFWYMWATMFAFEPWHSAVEFKRYLRRFLHEFPRINTLAGIDRTRYNQYDSVILPIETYLKNNGVDFRYETVVKSVSFSPGKAITVSDLHFASTKTGDTGTIHLEPHDIVMITPGSMTAASSLGTNTTPAALPPTVTDALQAPDGAWALWDSLASPEANPDHYKAFGNPKNFYSRIKESTWFSFTTTFNKNTEFFDRIEKWSGNKAGTGALVTFKDSSWFMSIVVAHQPHFITQPDDCQVFWGYGLYPDKVGDFVKKPMQECTGQELLQELCGHLNFPYEKCAKDSITIPCTMPYITAQFLTRKHGDRPPVIPAGSTNLALLGQFVEVPLDTVFTVEYSIRCAQIAVKELMGTKRLDKDIYKGEYNLKVLLQAAGMLMT